MGHGGIRHEIMKRVVHYLGYDYVNKWKFLSFSQFCKILLLMCL